MAGSSRQAEGFAASLTRGAEVRSITSALLCCEDALTVAELQPLATAHSPTSSPEPSEDDRAARYLEDTSGLPLGRPTRHWWARAPQTPESQAMLRVAKVFAATVVAFALALVAWAVPIGVHRGFWHKTTDYGDLSLAPTDHPLGFSCPTHGIVHFVNRLAGPWGLPLGMDGRHHPRHHRNLFAKHNQVDRNRVRRVVIYYDLNFPKNTFCKARQALDANGGDDVHLLTVGFPTEKKPRGLGRESRQGRRCAAVWQRDFMWLANQNASEALSSTCRHSKVMPTPCELLLGLVGRLRAPEFPNITDVRIMGFSAGGQLLDKCMYSKSRWLNSPNGPSGPTVKFFIVSPSTLLYPVTERAILPTLPELDCSYFGPESTLERRYEFRKPRQHYKDIANLTQEPGWYCNREELPNFSVDFQRDICEKKNADDKKYIYKFTQGNIDAAPGCHHHGKPCWCCRQRKDTDFQQRHACENYDHFRYGLTGRTPPDMPQGPPCSAEDCTPEVHARIRSALLDRHAIYIGGSADVCNWELQSRPQFQPKCGWCTLERTRHVDQPSEEVQFARDMLSPIVDSCRAMWEGYTRLERLKVFKEVIEKVVAPRVGISPLQLTGTREFWTLVGAGHADNTVVNLLAPCLIRDTCHNATVLMPIDHFSAR